MQIAVCFFPGISQAFCLQKYWSHGKYNEIISELRQALQPGHLAYPHGRPSRATIGFTGISWHTKQTRLTMATLLSLAPMQDRVENSGVTASLMYSGSHMGW